MTSVQAVQSNKTSQDTSTSSRCSARGIKRKSFFDETWDVSGTGKKPVRACERSGCPATIPICFANSTERCVGSGYTSRWHHISAGEHFCNECFEYFYRSHKLGYETFCKWKSEWSSKAKMEASVCVFMADKLLPFWVQCTRPECCKWRQLSRDFDLYPDFIRNFTCGMTSEGKKKERQLEACAVPEDHRVEMCRSPWWFSQLTASVGLKMSPSLHFLSDYSSDAIGHCPLDATYLQPENTSTKTKVWEMFGQPFSHSHETDTAGTVKADEMSESERNYFPHLAREPKIFLSLRNLIISLWNLSIKEWMTWQRCANYLIYRGVSRIKCVELLQSIIYYLTREGLINIGLLHDPPTSLLLPNVNYENHSVIVVGAGITGLAAARQLSNFGVKVTVLEAQNCLGGRVDEASNIGDMCLGQGTQIINNCVNNPICLMCMQADIDMKIIRDKYELIFENGQLALPESCRRLNFHFNAILDVIAEWRKDNALAKDTGLLSKFREAHDQFLEQSQIEFSLDEEKILEYYLGHMELVSGCSVEDLSSMHWDQHEAFPQLGSSSIMLCQGLSELLCLLSKDLDIQYNVEVVKIDYSEADVMVHASSGAVFRANKVLVTVPLSVLQKDVIDFVPHLPVEKTKAIKSLGAGVIEMIVLQFKKNFWREKVKDVDVFGYIASDESCRGLFSVFYDLSKVQKSGKETHVLVTYIAGNGLKKVMGKSSEEIVQACMDVLSKLFPEQKIPEPEQYYTSHWQKESSNRMSYSYVPVGVDASVYTHIAQQLHDKIFFAGEATCRQFPQSLAGAYWSGLRETETILKCFDQ
ncbi:lysine-specific histone demethylase 1B-like [Octopus vulgaris]|nr:lysine-specific histone demethylase 1B-like [Octopus vulgaris]